jgi:CTP:molybdopterin cytidylyltransferase MocA
MHSFISNSKAPLRRLILPSLLWCAGIFTAYSLAVMRLPVAVTVTATTGEQNQMAAQRYLYADHPIDTVLVGSSLTARLPDEALGPRLFNLALSSLGPATGVQIVLRKPQRPLRVIIETNVMLADVDRSFEDSIFAEPGHSLRGVFPALREEYRPMNILLNLVRGSEARNRQRLLDRRADLDVQKRMTAVFRTDYDKPVALDDMDRRLTAFKALVEPLQRAGVEILLAEMPIADDLQQTRLMAALRDRVNAIFPPAQYRRLDLHAAGPVETEDGLHLVYRDAVRIAHLLRSEIETDCTVGCPNATHAETAR